MLERFTARARRVVVLATEEARNRRHAAVGAEHLLLAILRDGAGLGVAVLQRLHVSPESLRAEVERILAAVPPSTNAEPHFSDELKSVLGATVEEQQRHGHDHIGTEHLLLGLLNDRSAVSGVLRAAGANLVEARRMTVVCIGENLRSLSPEEMLRAIATSSWRIRI